MKFDYPAPEGVLMPYELAMLQRLFNRALRKQGYAKTDVEAKMLATTMMDLYRRGSEMNANSASCSQFSISPNDPAGVASAWLALRLR